MKIQDIQSDKRYRDVVPITKDEQKAAELLALSDGEIYQPLFVWKDENILVYGYQYLKIINAHPDIKHTIREIDFEDWQQAQVWAIEHYIALPEVRLWQKLEAAVNCEPYWLLKEEAKKAHGNRGESSSVSEGNSDKSMEVNAIIARKVGCGATTVYNFKRILSSGKTDIIKACRKGELTINAAYSRLFQPKKPRKGKSQSSATTESVVGNGGIFDECRNNINIGKKNIARHNGIPVAPERIADKMGATKVPDGAIWIAMHKKEGQIQVAKKSLNESTGEVLTVVDAFNYKAICNDDEIIILEADHINGGTEELRQKDESEFEGKSRKAS